MGQIPSYNRAVALYQEKKMDAAKLVIDSVVLHPETSKDPLAWMQRSYIYYELYKAKDRVIANGKAVDIKINSALRDTSIQSILKAYSLNPDSDTKTNGAKLFVNYTNSYYKMANTYLVDSSNAEKSLQAFNKHLELVKMGDANANLKAKELEYYKAVGSHFADKFNLDNKEITSQNNAKSALLKALEIDPENYSANVNMGIMFFNQGSNIIKDGGIPTIEEMEIQQENALKLFKQATPFLLKAHTVNPQSKSALGGLEMMYRWLNEFDKAEMYKKKLDALGK